MLILLLIILIILIIILTTTRTTTHTLATTGAASVPQMRILFALKIRVSCFLVFIYKAQKTCNGKTKGLGTFPIYIRKPYAFFPLLAATGAPRRDQLRIFFALKIRVSIFLVFIYKAQKICNGKTKGLDIFFNFSIHFHLETF